MTKPLLAPDVPEHKHSAVYYDKDGEFMLGYFSWHINPKTGEKVNDGIPVSTAFKFLGTFH